jgi:hypothetical protein
MTTGRRIRRMLEALLGRKAVRNNPHAEALKRKLVEEHDETIRLAQKLNGEMAEAAEAFEELASFFEED